MEAREFALALLTEPTLAAKLRPPPAGVSDGAPGEPRRDVTSARPANLQIRPSREVRVPPIRGMADPSQRARIIHALANHELQAAELFAWALLAFPAAPARFRRGLLGICADEQRHCRMYISRLEAHGAGFGDYPVTGYFWNKVDSLDTPLTFVCTMGLTFENANLDFAVDYAAAARAAGDDATAAVIDQVHGDEIDHVRFAWHWLNELAPAGQDPWETYTSNVTWPLGPHRARGKSFDRAGRNRAGLDAEFIDRLENTAPKRPSGEPR